MVVLVSTLYVYIIEFACSAVRLSIKSLLTVSGKRCSTVKTRKAKDKLRQRKDKREKRIEEKKKRKKEKQ